ncbi:hypothetical protein MMC11_001336 [Xylographa trunciseda]|nr:hypothetical protein [Xylographa trunciseda]
MTSASALQSPDILLLILSLLDPSTLARFRLTSSRINSIITAHQRSICSSIALRTYSTSLDFLPSPHTALSSPGLGNLYIRALLRLRRAHLLVVKAIDESQRMPTSQLKSDSPEADEARARCTRGILVFWALIDIQQSLYPDEAPTPMFSEPYLGPLPMTRRQRMISRLLRFRNPASPPNLLVAQYDARAQYLCAAERAEPYRVVNAPSHPNGVDITSSGSAAASVARRFAAIKAAQIPFAALLSRSTRIDLEVAQGYLHLLLERVSAPDYGGHMPPNNIQDCWWKESWALRQGPAFVLALHSHLNAEVEWALRRMEKECKARSRDVLEAERTTPIFLFEDAEMGRDGTRPLWAEAWEVRGGMQ